MEAYPYLHPYMERIINTTYATDKKRVTMVLKINEEWVKCYKSKSLIQNDDEEEHPGVEEASEDVKQPYDLP